MQGLEKSFRFILGDLEGICKECVQGGVEEAVGAKDDDVDAGARGLGQGLGGCRWAVREAFQPCGFLKGL